MKSPFLLLFLFFLQPSLQKLTHSEAPSRESYLRKLPDQILADLHNEMREVMALRAEKLPNAKNVKHVNLDRTLSTAPGMAHFGYKWSKGKFIRSYKQRDWIISKGLKAHNTMTKKNHKKKSHVRLDLKRFRKREFNKDQSHCMLYAKIHAIENITRMHVVLLKITFRSPCFESTVTRVFTIKTYHYVPEVVKLHLGTMVYYLEFYHQKSVVGGGHNRREKFSTFRLINYYISLINPKFKNKKKQDIGKIIAKNTHKKAGRKLKTTKLGLKKIKKKIKKKNKTRTLYLLRKHKFIPFMVSGNHYIVLSVKDNLRPYHAYEVLKHVWEGNNPTSCTAYYHSQKASRYSGTYYYWNYFWSNDEWRWQLKSRYYYYTAYSYVHGMRCYA